MEITIREAKISDYQVINQLNSISLGYEYDVSKAKKNLEKILGLKYYKIYVAEYNAVVIGYVHGSDYDNTYMDSLKNIMGIAVSPSYQGKGIGRMLLEAIEKWAKEDGCLGVRLVSGYNRKEAHEFYKHCGYQMRKQQLNFIKWI